MKLNHISLFIFLLIILLTLSPVKSSITFEETQHLTATPPRVFSIDCYDDNTIIARIIRAKSKAPPKICVEEYLSIRTIYPNGTVKEFDLSSDTLNIQSLNFCLLPKASPLRFYPVKKNFLLITYVEAEDINNPFTYNDWGIVIDLDGVIHSKIMLGPSYVNITTKEWKPGQDSIKLNVHRDNGFIRAAPITNSTGFSLQQFKIDENGKIQQIGDTVNIYPTGYPLETVATMDGGYALIYPNNTGSTTISTTPLTPLTPQFGIYCLLLGYGKGITQGPFVLYQTLTPIKVLLLDCDFTYVGVGQTCIIIANSTQADKTFIKIDFLSSGTVYNITTFQNTGTTDYSIKSLKYGGYFSFYTVRSSDNKNFDVYGYIMDYYGTFFNWDLTYPTLANPIADVLVLPNNSLVIPQPENEQTWSLLTTDLYKIEGERDHGYDNLHIDTTIPKIGDVINPSETKFLIIKYYNKIDLSPNRNVTIIQDDGTSHGIIRQMTSMTSTGNNGYDKFVNLIDDEFGSIINITIINSTFNKPGGKYYVLIDDGFANSRGYHEPMIGIQSSAWSFTTLQEDDHDPTSIKEIYQKKMSATSIYGNVRLTSGGTIYFKSIKHDKLKYKEFFDNLTRELAKAIPVSPERITTSEKYEIDTSVSPEQYILSINIEEAKNDDERSVNSVASDLDTLIKNKFVTLIGTGAYSNYLDHKYGYVTIPRWIEKNLKSLIITIVLNIVFLSFSAKEKNYSIYTCGNSIEKFVATIFFTSIDAGSIENIFNISIFLVTFPFIVNLGFAFIIIINEFMRTDLPILLTKIDELTDELLDGGTDDDSDSINELIIDNDSIKKSSKELKKVIRELRINKDLEKVSKLTEEINKVNEVIGNETINETEKKNIIKKLKIINELINGIMQFEDFAEELKEIENLTEKLDKKVNKFTDESKQDSILIEEIEHLPEELKKIKELTKKLKKVKEFAEKVSKFAEERELEDILIIGENVKNFADKLNKRVIDDDVEDDDIMEVENEERSNNENEENVSFINRIKEKCKKWYSRNIKNKVDHPIKQKKGYQKFSKWLKDSKEHRKVTALFVLLAGVNITHLRLLSSKMKIPWVNIYLNAKLSRAAKRKLIWGAFVNAIIGDISLIILQSFYVTRVVSLGYTPVYNISKASIDFFNKGFLIIKHMLTSYYI